MPLFYDGITPDFILSTYPYPRDKCCYIPYQLHFSLCSGQIQTITEKSRYKQNAENTDCSMLTSHGYIHNKTLTHKAQGMLEKSGWRDCKKQRTRKSVICEIMSPRNYREA